MTKTLKLLVFSGASFLVAASPAWAGLLGTQVSGSMIINGAGPNYFDPANGYVDGPNGTFPGGSLNSAGTTVTISGTSVEFGYMDGANTDSADFTGSQLTLTDVAVNDGSLPITYSFTDTAFGSLSLSTNSFGSGFSYSLVGDLITINTGDFQNNGTFQAVFNIGPNSVPDATSTGGLLGLGLLSVAAFKRFKFSSV
jgi:hypothetical protein